MLSIELSVLILSSEYITSFLIFFIFGLVRHGTISIVQELILLGLIDLAGNLCASPVAEKSQSLATYNWKLGITFQAGRKRAHPQGDRGKEPGTSTENVGHGADHLASGYL